MLEDVHWGDDALLDVVEQLADHRGGGRCSWSARPGPSSPTAGRDGAPVQTRCRSRWNAWTTRKRAHLLVRASPGPARRATPSGWSPPRRAIPLFAEHLAALIADRDPAVGLPRSIQVLLSARLEALPEPEREVVSVAAVAGREFPVAAVEALTGRAVEASSSAAWLSTSWSCRSERRGLRQFAHTLLQESAYEPDPEAAARGAAHADGGLAVTISTRHDAAVGDHLDRAYRLRSELGLADETTAAIREQAGARLATAGRRADAMGEPVRASLLLERALELLPDRSPVQAAAMVELAAAGWNLLPRSERMRLLDDGAERAARHGLRALELRARILVLGATDWTLRPPPGA